MRLLTACFLTLLACPFLAGAAASASAPPSDHPAATVDRLFEEALSHGKAYGQLEELVSKYPGRLTGTVSLAGAVEWSQQKLAELGLDRIYTQSVTVPHWDRGEPESVRLLTNEDAEPLSAVALGFSGATPAGGLVAPVIEVQSLDELATLGREKIEGRIVFFNRPMNPAYFQTGKAYGEAGDQRGRGPAAAAKLGAVAAIVRSLTLADDDVPHTGYTGFGPDITPIPAAALSTRAADRLSAALRANSDSRVEVKIHARRLADTESHNVIGEIRGSEFPDRIMVVGGHLDSWDIAPGAHDDGAGVVQSIEVLRLFKALGLRPRHTLRCVLFTAEENSLAGGIAYAAEAKEKGERHVLALESDGGGYAPAAFYLGSTQGPMHQRAQRWLPLFQAWGIWKIAEGPTGADVAPLLMQGVTVGQIVPDSQRYFDIHHTREDTIDKVNARELHLGAAALAAMVWLVDREGF